MGDSANESKKARVATALWFGLLQGVVDLAQRLLRLCLMMVEFPLRVTLYPFSVLTVEGFRRTAMTCCLSPSRRCRFNGYRWTHLRSNRAMREKLAAQTRCRMRGEDVGIDKRLIPDTEAAFWRPFASNLLSPLVGTDLGTYTSYSGISLIHLLAEGVGVPRAESSCSRCSARTTDKCRSRFTLLSSLQTSECGPLPSEKRTLLILSR